MTRWAVLGVVLASTGWGQPYLRTRANDEGLVCVAWVDRTIVFTPDSAGSTRTPGDTEFVAIDQAIGAWVSAGQVCSDLRVLRAVAQPLLIVGRDTRASNAIVFRETACEAVVPVNHACQADSSCSNLFQCWDDATDTIALTTTTYSPRTGELVDADIALNAARFLFTTVSSPPCPPNADAPTCVATDVQNTLTHELGHALGFAHVDGETSTMAPTADLGDIQKRTVDEGTRRGLCETYPVGLQSPSCEGLASTSLRLTGSSVSVCSATSAAPAWLSILCSMLMWRRVGASAHRARRKR
ncbi:MAG: hypothetical protein JNG84_05710 [Archangium sp.]|nr:hypothetical protein [Archangium sp.]